MGLSSGHGVEKNAINKSLLHSLQINLRTLVVVTNDLNGFNALVSIMKIWKKKNEYVRTNIVMHTVLTTNSL